jgi:hypothetical protein
MRQGGPSNWCRAALPAPASMTASRVASPCRTCSTCAGVAWGLNSRTCAAAPATIAADPNALHATKTRQTNWQRAVFTLPARPPVTPCNWSRVHAACRGCSLILHMCTGSGLSLQKRAGSSSSSDSHPVAHTARNPNAAQLDGRETFTWRLWMCIWRGHRGAR